MATKTEQLTALPLWECGDCGRLEFASVQPDCPQCYVDQLAEQPMAPVACPGSVETFEAIGQHFYRDTGLVRPGKDSQTHTFEYRVKAFSDWNAPSKL